MATSGRQQEKFCVLLPAYNEEGRIAPVVRELLSLGHEPVVIDDGSVDATADEAEAAGAVVLRQETNQGKGLALNAGFSWARTHGYDALVTMDSDGQHRPAEVGKFIDAYVRTGIPVLVGNRMFDPHGMPAVRRWTNQFMSWLLSKSMGQYVPDTQCGFRLFRCDVIPVVAPSSERFAAESEILLHVAKRGIRIGAVRISTIYADEKSKINPLVDTFRFFSMLFHYERNRKRHRFSGKEG